MSSVLLAQARPVVYVDASSPSGGDGTNWGSAYKQLRDVLPSVASGSDIWIATGTYKPSATNGKTTYFTINAKNLRIFGGFVGNETSFKQRDLSAANETILSGDYLGNDGTIYNSTAFSDNAYHVFVITDSNVTMDGLTIKGGNARVPSSDEDSGGGIRAQTNTILNINNCSLESNYAVSYGGGIATFSGTKLNFSNSILQNNYNGYNGGAGLSLWGGVHSFHNSIFYNNDGSQVGAVLVHTGGTSFNNCLFVNNDGWSRRWAGAGALHLRSASTINNCTFYNNNFADTSSGGDLDFSSTVTVNNSIFWHPTKSANLLGGSGTLVMSNSIVRGGASGTSVSTQNPLFLNTSNIKGADGKWFTDDDGFQLSASSPAKSAGLLSAILSDVFDIDADGNITEASPLDLAGNPRPYGAALDLGAYEYLDPNTAPTDLNSTSPLTIAENQPVGTVVGEFNATDPDGDALTYHLVSGVGDRNNSLFTLDANGTLTTATIFDYESNASTFTIRLEVRDEYNASVEGNFTVTLLNENEPTSGSVVITGTPVVGQTLTAQNSLTDPDGLGTITYQWYRDGVPILLGGTLKDGVNEVDGLYGAKSLTLSADGNHAYVTGFNDHAVSWYERNASTGALTFGGLLRECGWSGRIALCRKRDALIGRKPCLRHGLYGPSSELVREKREHGIIELFRDLER